MGEGGGGWTAVIQATGDWSAPINENWEWKKKVGRWINEGVRCAPPPLTYRVPCRRRVRRIGIDRVGVRIGVGVGVLMRVEVKVGIVRG